MLKELLRMRLEAKERDKCEEEEKIKRKKNCNYNTKGNSVIKVGFPFFQFNPDNKGTVNYNIVHSCSL